MRQIGRREDVLKRWVDNIELVADRSVHVWQESAIGVFRVDCQGSSLPASAISYRKAKMSPGWFPDWRWKSVRLGLAGGLPVKSLHDRSVLAAGRLCSDVLARPRRVSICVQRRFLGSWMSKLKRETLASCQWSRWIKPYATSIRDRARNRLMLTPIGPFPKNLSVGAVASQTVFLCCPIASVIPSRWVHSLVL